MSGGAVFFIAIRYLLGRAKEGGRYLRGAATGIAVSLVPIIVTLIVADGMIRGITDRYLELGTGHVQVYDFAGAKNLEEIKDAVTAQEDVRGAWIEWQGMGVLVGGKGKAAASIRAIESGFWEDEGAAAYLEVVSGNARFEADNEVFLGAALADSVGVAAGDMVRLMTVRIADDGRSVPRMTPFKVKAVVSAGYREIDALWCITTYDAGKRIFAGAESASNSFLLLKIDDPYKDADSCVRFLYTLLGSGYGVYTWKEMQMAQYSSYESTRQMLLFIMALIVIIAAVNVSSATSMLAIERRKDIAAFKAAGASPAFTSRIFVWAAFITGLIGAIVGITAGLCIGLSINHIIRALEAAVNFCMFGFSAERFKLLDPNYYLEQFPVIIDWLTILIIGVFTVLCSIVASYLPARRAGTLKPLEILRKL
ncbi:MAG: ABC transporter permease [Treponema sp.]|jgi:lipoprotein-releasing system permease protein|nr:ABC transporter permease [Treponema sp.]